MNFSPQFPPDRIHPLQRCRSRQVRFPSLNIRMCGVDGYRLLIMRKGLSMGHLQVYQFWPVTYGQIRLGRV